MLCVGILPYIHIFHESNPFQLTAITPLDVRVLLLLINIEDLKTQKWSVIDSYGLHTMTIHAKVMLMG